MNRPHLQTGWAAVAVGAAVALGLAIPSRYAGRLPQASGEDMVSLVLGDARLEVSRVLEEKADDYFHGGIHHADCGGLSDHHDHLETDEGHGEDQHEADGHDDHDHADTSSERGGAFDPWQWIDARVHVQAHRHLHGDQAVELLPWLWGACRMSPKNADAYLNGAYVLAHMLQKPAEAVRLLDEGIRQNPATPELDFSLGEIVLNVQHDSGKAERCFTSTREKCLPVQSSAARAEDLLLLRLRALFYLGYLAKQRGDIDRVRACLDEAESLEPGHKVVADLRALLEAKGDRRP